MNDRLPHTLIDTDDAEDEGVEEKYPLVAQVVVDKEEVLMDRKTNEDKGKGLFDL